MNANLLTKSKRNNSIDIFRLICAIMVVAIHTHPFEGVNKDLAYFFVEIFPRIAVPFFFCTIGYFYIGTLLSGKNNFKKTFIKLLKIYAIWSVIYFIVNFFSSNVIESKEYLTFFRSTLIGFFVSGTYYHFWFFPACFFAIIVSTICYRFKCIKLLAGVSIALYILGCLGCSYYAIGNKIPGISSLINYSHFTTIRMIVLMGLPFFMLGYFIQCFKKKHETITNRKALIWLFALLLAFLLEIYIVVEFELQISVVTTFTLYPLLAVTFILLLFNPLQSKLELAKYSKVTANFMFYSHPLIIIALSHFLEIGSIILFLLTCIIAAACSFVIFKINNKYLNVLIY